MPNISLNPRARYVTQASIFTTCYCGPLTNRKIAKYKKLGYYGQDGILAQSKEKTKKKAKSSKRTTEAVLKKLYVF